MQNILCNVCQPIPILVAEVWQRNLDYVKNLQAKIFHRLKYPDLQYAYNMGKVACVYNSLTHIVHDHDKSA